MKKWKKKKETVDYRYYETDKGEVIVRKKRKKTKSLLEQGFRKQARDIKKGAKQIWP